MFTYYFGTSPWGVQARTRMLIMNHLYLSQSFQKFPGMKKKYLILVQELFSWLIIKSHRTSMIKFLEIFSNEGFTKFHSLCFIIGLLSIFELQEEQNMGQTWPLESSSIFFSVMLFMWLYMNTHALFSSPCVLIYTSWFNVMAATLLSCTMCHKPSFLEANTLLCFSNACNG